MVRDQSGQNNPLGVQKWNIGSKLMDYLNHHTNQKQQFTTVASEDAGKLQRRHGGIHF